MKSILLSVKGVSKDFAIRRGMLKSAKGIVRALDNVSFDVTEYETLGVVGESGSGKTTLAKIIMRLIPLTSGEIVFTPSRITHFYRDVQIIFQNPYYSLDPSLNIYQQIAEPLHIQRIATKKELKNRVTDLLMLVGLDKSALMRYPWQFSGGQRQRICIARALATNPKFLILDEPISSLDLTIQSRMLDLFLELKEKLKLTYIFISHNLAVIKYLCGAAVVMKGGKIVEQGPVSKIFSHPSHEYTHQLLHAAQG